MNPSPYRVPSPPRPEPPPYGTEPPAVVVLLMLVILAGIIAVCRESPGGHEHGRFGGAPHSFVGRGHR